MNEPYKSCWECKTCDDLKEHQAVCMGDEFYGINITPLEILEQKVRNTVLNEKLDKLWEENRAKLKA